MGNCFVLANESLSQHTFKYVRLYLDALKSFYR